MCEYVFLITTLHPYHHVRLLSVVPTRVRDLQRLAPYPPDPEFDDLRDHWDEFILGCEALSYGDEALALGEEGDQFEDGEDKTAA